MEEKGTLYAAYIEGLKDLSSRPNSTTEQKVTPELEQKIVLGLRLDSSFGTARIKFRLNKRLWVSLSSSSGGSSGSS
ncbi:MAG TPA: hypothetical protein VNI77_08970, partial [Nitrososphaera sp.]|nr:hypothetical protein [Nitrososphaera sp.]